MRLFEKQDDAGQKRKPRTAKLLRRFKHKAERRRAKANPDGTPTYNKYRGWAL